MLDLFETPGDYSVLLIGGRRCSRCGEVKPIEEFPIKNKARGLRRVWCRDCCRVYGREHYRKNTPYYIRKARRREKVERAHVRALIDEYLRQHHCVDCGCTDITLLEFDHRDPSQKRNAIGRIALMGSWPSVLREIEKCDVRCANCHRRRTASQFGWARVSGVAIDPAEVRPGASGRYARMETAEQDALFSDEPHGLRRCSMCGELKPLAAFPFRRLLTGERAHYCRPCRAAYRRAHYEKNRADYITRAKAEMRMKREDAMVLIYEYLSTHPCVDCGQTDMVLLEFDHTDPREKTMEVSKMAGRRGWDEIIAEMDKCVVRCANCHRKRTAAQRGWKWRLAEAGGRYRTMVVTRVWRSGSARHSQCRGTVPITVTRSVTTPR